LAANSASNAFTGLQYFDRPQPGTYFHSGPGPGYYNYGQTNSNANAGPQYFDRQQPYVYTNPGPSFYGQRQTSSYVNPGPQFYDYQMQSRTIDDYFMPRPEFAKFDGNPLNYRIFINGFEKHIETKVSDGKLRLCYLIQHCEVKVKSKIQHFSNKGDQGYQLATDACEHQLKTAPFVKSNDPESLKRFAELLERVLITLDDINYLGSLNALDTMAQLANKLPFDLKRAWVKESVKIENQTNRVADFRSFVNFVIEQSDVANSLFGSKILGTKQQNFGPGTNKTVKSKMSSYSVKTSKIPPTSILTPKPAPQSSFACFYCKEKSHRLAECQKFKKAPLSERISFIKSNKFCYKCLSSKHRTYECVKQNTCFKHGCTGTYHHTLLHPEKSSKSNAAAPESSSSTPSPSNTSGESNTAETVASYSLSNAKISANTNEGVYLCVVPVTVGYGDRYMRTYAFLDQGSTRSFCDKNLVGELGASGSTEEVTLQTLTGTKSHQGQVITFSLSSLGSNEKYSFNALSIPSIPVSPNPVPSKGDLHRYAHLKGITFPRIPGSHVSLLIGSDFPEMFCIQEVRKGARGEPIAIKTPVGWSLLGPSLSLTASTNCNVNFVKTDASLQRDINCLWESDFSCGTSVLDVPSSKEDRLVYDLLQKSVSSVDGHYQVPLPWRSNTISPGDSLPMARQRLESLRKRLLKDDTLHQKYTDVIETYLKNSYARVVPTDELESSSTAWTLPHFPVYHPRKSKVRIVFDCAAKWKGVSLNDMLMQGPDLVSNLVGVLIRFRQESIALTADIECMFHQIRVPPQDAHALRFLWWPGGDLSLDPVVHQMQVHLFGATSSPSCAAFCLRQTAIDFGDQFDPNVAEIVRQNYYVDDCLCCTSSLEEAKVIVQQLTELLSKGGFHLTKWLTNCPEVLNSIPVQERSTCLQRQVIDSDTSERVLGVLWNVLDDTFGFNINFPDKPVTRRGILSTLSSLYDPLGFVAPVILIPKLLLQSLCKAGIGWDEVLTHDQTTEWQAWLSNLSHLNHLHIPRCYKPMDFGIVSTVELHHFADSSAEAYGACSYLRLTSKQGSIHCSLLIGKCRLSPLKVLSIPKLELTAAVLAVRLDIMVRKELRFDACTSTFWSDSTAVLQMIKNSKKRFPVFIANRLSVIETHTNPESWRHVPSQLNPADLASRGCSAKALLKSSSWFSGPDFLWKNEDYWPQGPVLLTPLPELDVSPAANVLAFSLTSSQTPNVIDDLISHYSSFQRLKKTVAWLLRVKSFLKAKLQSDCAQLDTSALTVQELQYAELELVKHEQMKHFSNLITLFTTGASKFTKSKLPRFLLKLKPIFTDGVLRVGGRLENAPVRFDSKHPIILPSDSHLTKLIIEDHHIKVGHSGMGHTWSSLRQTFWIIKGSATVRRVLGKCMLCRKRNASVGTQQMADLPTARLQIDKPPFSHVGVDYFGPIMVSQGRSQVKRYGCIFTCLTIRSVHIEISHNLTTDSFLNALRRFIARRGKPEHIVSDNGTNLVGASKVLRTALREWNQSQINNYLQQQEIQWTFNPPAASHMGGSWERLIRSVRRILSALFTSQSISDEILLTVMAEVESIINSRPLVPVTFEPGTEEPLTPNHLLLFRSNHNLPPGLFDKRDCYARRRWAQTQYLTNQFWLRWVREFLPHIIHMQKWFCKKRNFEKDDIVLVVDETQPRSRWALGRIIDTYSDSKGLVRSVLVKSQNTLLKRPITKLCLILESNEQA